MYVDKGLITISLTGRHGGTSLFGGYTESPLGSLKLAGYSEKIGLFT